MDLSLYLEDIAEDYAVLKKKYSKLGEMKYEVLDKKDKLRRQLEGERDADTEVYRDNMLARIVKYAHDKYN